MKKTNKVLSIILAVMMVISIIPVSASATDTTGSCGDNLIWVYDATTFTLTISGEGDMYDYAYNTLPWGSYRYKVKTVIIEDGVTSIGNCAFYRFEYLKSATIPEGVTVIGDYAFYYCEDLTDVVVPESTVTIGRYAFQLCQEIENITISENVTSIGVSALSNCYNLQSITVDEDNQYYSSDENGTLFDKAKTVLIQYPTGSKTNSYAIPDGVQVIESNAFYWVEYLTDVVIPDSVTTIESSAFSSCHHLENLVIGNGVTTIDKMAFYQCQYLKSVFIGKSVATIGLKAFYESDRIEVVYYNGTKAEWYQIDAGKYNDSLLEATIVYGYDYNNGVLTGNCGDNLTCSYDSDTGVLTVSGTGAMYDYDWDTRPWNYFEAEIKSVVINEGVTTVGTKAFHSLTNLESVSLPDSLISIGECSFYNNPKLTTVTIPENVTTIDNNAFYSCENLESVVIPDKVTAIGWNAFNDCEKLETVLLGEGLTSIGSSAFAYCDSLKEVVIPANVTDIGEYAFYSCNNLEAVNVDDDNKYYSSDEYGVLFDKAKSKVILYPTGNERTEYVIPDTVTVIGESAFEESVNLINVTIPYGVETIGNQAFEYCTGLAEVTIPSTVTTIGSYAFSDCKEITSVDIPDNVTAMGDGAFHQCENLTTVVIGDGLTELADYVFIDCIMLENVTLGSNIENLGISTFEGCTSLKNIEIPDGVTSIRGSTFNNCLSLESITVPASVTGIGYGSFDGCENLADIYYSGIREEWNNIEVFDGNAPLETATIHCDCIHNYSQYRIITESGLGEIGEAEYICEHCGDVIIGEYQSGDTDGDGICSENDYAMILQASICGIELTGEQTAASDVNGDGAVDTFDAMMLNFYMN